MKKILLIWTSTILLVFVSSITVAQAPNTQTVTTPETLKGNPSSNIKDGLLDINKATRDQLTALGLSSAAADRIIQERPFHRKHDLLSDKVLNEEEFSIIRGKIFAWSPTKSKPVK